MPGYPIVVRAIQRLLSVFWKTERLPIASRYLVSSASSGGNQSGDPPRKQPPKGAAGTGGGGSRDGGKPPGPKTTFRFPSTPNPKTPPHQSEITGAARPTRTAAPFPPAGKVTKSATPPIFGVTSSHKGAGDVKKEEKAKTTFSFPVTPRPDAKCKTSPLTKDVDNRPKSDKGVSTPFPPQFGTSTPFPSDAEKAKYKPRFPATLPPKVATPPLGKSNPTADQQSKRVAPTPALKKTLATPPPQVDKNSKPTTPMKPPSSAPSADDGKIERPQTPLLLTRRQPPPPSNYDNPSQRVTFRFTTPPPPASTPPLTKNAQNKNTPLEPSSVSGPIQKMWQAFRPPTPIKPPSSAPQEEKNTEDKAEPPADDVYSRKVSAKPPTSFKPPATTMSISKTPTLPPQLDKVAKLTTKLFQTTAPAIKKWAETTTAAKTASEKRPPYPQTSYKQAQSAKNTAESARKTTESSQMGKTARYPTFGAATPTQVPPPFNKDNSRGPASPSHPPPPPQPSSSPPSSGNTPPPKPGSIIKAVPTPKPILKALAAPSKVDPTANKPPAYATTTPKAVKEFKRGPPVPPPSPPPPPKSPRSSQVPPPPPDPPFLATPHLQERSKLAKVQAMLRNKLKAVVPHGDKDMQEALELAHKEAKKASWAMPKEPHKQDPPKHAPGMKYPPKEAPPENPNPGMQTGTKQIDPPGRDPPHPPRQPVAPTGTYHVPEFFEYTKTSFYDIEMDIAEKRGPQQSSKKKKKKKDDDDDSGKSKS